MRTTDIRAALDVIALSRTPQGERLRLARFVAGQGTAALPAVYEWVADELEAYPRLVEWASTMLRFDQMAAPTRLIEEIDRFYDPRSQSFVVREVNYGDPSRDADRAILAIQTARLSLGMAAWIIGHAGDPSATRLITPLGEPPISLPARLIADATEAARSGARVRLDESERRIALPAQSRWLSVLTEQLTTTRDRERIIGNLGRTGTGRQALGQLLEQLAVEVSTRPNEWIARMAMFDPERAQRHMAAERMASEVAILICGEFRSSRDRAVIPQLRRAVTELRSGNPEAGLTRIAANTLADLER